MASSSIIDEKYLPTIESALSDLDRAARELELARRAGVFKGEAAATLQNLTQKVQSNKEALLQLKSVYFPNA